MKRRCYFPNLGTDFILTEILPRLPAKSIIRFQCISKSFNNLISSTEFGPLYIRHQPLSCPPSLLVFNGPSRITCHDLDSTYTATFDWHKTNAYVVGSSNGLVCFCTYSHMNLLVLNPTTRIFQDIRIPVEFEELHDKNLWGFAFDPENLDFKIMAFSSQQSTTRIANVYSLNTNSWTKIETELQEDREEISRDAYNSITGTLIKNSLLHWMFWTSPPQKYRICCFDVGKSKWVDDVLLPHCFDDPINVSSIPELGVFDECLFLSFRNKVESCHDVWVMKEYGVQDSWVKLFSIPVSNVLQGKIVPVAYREGSSEVLIQELNKYKLFWYNRNNGGVNEVKLDGVQDLRIRVRMCRRSLVDIPGGKLFASTWFPSEVV